MKEKTGNRNDKSILFPELTPEAAARWYEIPATMQRRVLDAVWCSKCRTRVAMKLESGVTIGNALILDGTCAVCGSGVSRVIETRD